MNKAAQALGRLARGVPKRFSAAELARRTAILARVNARRQARAASGSAGTPRQTGPTLTP